VAHPRPILRERSPQPSALPIAASDHRELGSFCHFRVRAWHGTFGHILAVWVGAS